MAEKFIATFGLSTLWCCVYVSMLEDRGCGVYVCGHTLLDLPVFSPTKRFYVRLGVLSFCHRFAKVCHSVPKFT